MKPLRVVSAALVIVTLAACDQGGSSRTKELRAEIDQVNESYFEAQQTAKRLQSQLEAARQEKTKLEEAVKKAEEDKEASKKELERVKQEFDVYKSKYKVSVHSRVPGFMVPDFELAGRSYKSVKLTQFDSELIAFTHEGGLSKLNVADLPELTRDILGLTEKHNPLYALQDEAPRPVSLKKRLAMESAKLRENEMAIDDRLRVNSRARTAAARELGEAQEKIERARLNGGQTVLLEKYASEVQLRINQLDAEQVALEVERHELSERRITLR